MEGVCAKCKGRGYVVCADVDDSGSSIGVMDNCPDCTDEDTYIIGKLSRLLAEIAVIVNGPEPPMTRWSYHDLPEKVLALALKDAAGRKAVGAVFEKLPQSQTPKSTGRFG